MSEHLPGNPGPGEHQSGDDSNYDPETADEVDIEPKGLIPEEAENGELDSAEPTPTDGRYRIDPETRGKFGTDTVSSRELPGGAKSSGATVETTVETNEDDPFDPETLTPPGWTLLKYGANTGTWPDLDSTASLELGSDTETITRETEKRDGDGPVRAGARAGDGDPVEVCVVFPAQDVSSQLETVESSTALQSRLGEQQHLVDEVYYKNWQQGRQPLLPKGLNLEKIGQHHNEETGRKEYYFIPEALADLYADDQGYERGYGEESGSDVVEGDAAHGYNEQTEEEDYSGETADQIEEESGEEEALADQREAGEDLESSQASPEPAETEADRPDSSPETDHQPLERAPEQNPDTAPYQEDILKVRDFTNKLASNMGHFKQYAESVGMGDYEEALQDVETIIASFSPEEQREFIDKVKQLAASSELRSLQKGQSPLNNERPDPNGSMVQRAAYEAYQQVFEGIVRPLYEEAVQARDDEQQE